jgi:DNA-binding transcriptional LysR family regulator
VVDRARSGVILTAAGQEAVRRAEAILAQAEDLVQAARGAGQPLAGRFRLGVIPTVAPYLLPRALPALRDQFPKLKLYPARGPDSPADRLLEGRRPGRRPDRPALRHDRPGLGPCRG